jgi:hypothetical protein
MADTPTRFNRRLTSRLTGAVRRPVQRVLGGAKLRGKAPGVATPLANLVIMTFPPVGNEADLIRSVDAGYCGRRPYRAIPPLPAIFLCISAMVSSSLAISW